MTADFNNWVKVMQRFHNLDFLRAFAMMMGLFIHATMLFTIPDLAKEFQIENITPAEDWVWYLVTFIINWRMPLFFLLSGFFAVLVIEKKGCSYFIKDRIIRIGLTCLLFSAFYDMLDGRFDFTTVHLWFLYELMIFALCFSLLYKTKVFKDIVCTTISPKIFFIISLWLIATVPLAHILNNSLHPLALLPPETYFSLKPGNLVYYFSYFLLGVLLYSNQQIFSKLSENKTITILGILSVLAYFAQVYAVSLLFSELEDIINARYLKFEPILVLFFAFTKGINTILWCLFFIGLASKFIQSGSAILRWFVELSYPIYIVHVIPLLIVSAGLYLNGFSQIGNFSLTIIIGFIVCIFLYYIFIKFTPLNWLINGYHKSFLQLKFKRGEK
jgi:glucan biosynthesis protein C